MNSPSHQSFKGYLCAKAKLQAAAAILVCTSSAALATARTPDARLELAEGSVAVCVGIGWARGTLHYGGQHFSIKWRGSSLVRAGESNITAVADVYGLGNVDQLAGSYAADSPAAAYATDGNVTRMKNEQRVEIEIRSTGPGADLDLTGLEIKVDKPGR